MPKSEPAWWAEARALRASAPHLSDSVLGRRFGKTKGAIRRVFNNDYYRAHDAARFKPEYKGRGIYKKKFTVHVDEDTTADIIAIAKANGITVSEQIRQFITWGIETENKYEDSNDF